MNKSACKIVDDYKKTFVFIENRKKVRKHYVIDLKQIVICGNLLSEVMKDEKDKIYFALVFIGSCIY